MSKSAMINRLLREIEAAAQTLGREFNERETFVNLLKLHHNRLRAMCKKFGIATN